MSQESGQYIHKNDGEFTTSSLQETQVDPAQRSIDILRSLQDADWFSQDRADKSQIAIYYRDGDGVLAPYDDRVRVEDFLIAVDYYVANREVEPFVDIAMNKNGGTVNVFTGSEAERKIAVQLDNYKIPQILEFAYRLIRNTQEKLP